MSSEFKEVLAQVLERRLAGWDSRVILCLPGMDQLKPADRNKLKAADVGHLNRWIENADSSVWQFFHPKSDDVFGFIELVLEERRIAAAANDALDLNAAKHERLNRLAFACDELAAFYRNPGILLIGGRFKRELMSLEELVALHVREAELLRSEAPPIRAIDISRQGKNKKKGGERTRGELTFMRQMSRLMVELYGKKHNQIVAELTNIAFDLENPVRAMTCIPDTPDALLTRVQIAAALTEAGFPTSPYTLSSQATRGGGPPYSKFGVRPLYQWGAALQWAKNKLRAPVRSTSESGRAA
jgi:hypothetical protein